MWNVRLLKKFEKKQRGCDFCLDHRVWKDDADKPHFACIHNECPYKVLDKYETYDEFLASEDSRILVAQFFDLAGEDFKTHKITKRPMRMFSDGSSRIYL